MTYLDPRLLAKLSNLNLRVRYVVEGMMSGLHASPFKGHALEFAQHREYSSGDEIRHIDWKVFGRSEKFFVKQFQDETNLRAFVLLDASGSMGFSSGRSVSKLTYASYLAAAISYILLSQQDAVSLSIFDEKIRLFLPAGQRFSHLSEIYENLENLVPGGETDIDNVLKEFGRHLKKRSLLILISDLLGDPEKIVKAVKYFRFRHHEPIVLQVLDPEEIEFSFAQGENIFVNMENKTRIFADSDDIKKAYNDAFRQFIAGYQAGFRNSGIDFYTFTTTTPLEMALGQCLSKRR
jgi:uncharacterized protein (DUF58 family)